MQFVASSCSFNCAGKPDPFVLSTVLVVTCCPLLPASTLSRIFPLFLLYLSSKYIPNMMLRSILLSSALLASTNGFAFVPANMKSSTTTQLQMGLLDGVKNAFSQPAMERSTLNAERETPIDRWMGWSVVQENQQVEAGSGGKWNESELFLPFIRYILTHVS